MFEIPRKNVDTSRQINQHRIYIRFKRRIELKPFIEKERGIVRKEIS